MSEISIIIDELSGTLLVEDNRQVDSKARQLLTDNLGTGQVTGCARPVVVFSPPIVSQEEKAGSICMRIAGYYHNSLVEGPGRRSSVLFQFCPLSCKGCWVPRLHSPDGGELVPVSTLVEKLLDPSFECDESQHSWWRTLCTI